MKTQKSGKAILSLGDWGFSNLSADIIKLT